MFTEKNIRLKNKNISGIEVKLSHANLVLAISSRGYICCGYLNLETAERLGDAACVVIGVKTLEDLLKSNIVNLTHSATPKNSWSLSVSTLREKNPENKPRCLPSGYSEGLTSHAEALGVKKGMKAQEALESYL